VCQAVIAWAGSLGPDGRAGFPIRWPFQQWAPTSPRSRLADKTATGKAVDGLDVATTRSSRPLRAASATAPLIPNAALLGLKTYKVSAKRTSSTATPVVAAVELHLRKTNSINKGPLGEARDASANELRARSGIEGGDARSRRCMRAPARHATLISGAMRGIREGVHRNAPR